MNNEYYSATKRVELYLTPEQSVIIDKYITGYKIVYNWSLEQEINQYDLFINNKSDRSFLSFIDLQNMYPDFRNSNKLLKSIRTHSMMNAIKDMIHGYELFFKYKDQLNKPQFKTVDGLYSSYKPRNETSSFYFNDNMLRVEGLGYQEFIRTSYHTGLYRKDNIHYINPIIYRNNRTNKYYLNYVISKPKLDYYFIENNIPKSDPIGIDVNKHFIYACSNGIMIPSRDVSRIENHINELNKHIQRDYERYNEILKETPNVPMSRNMIFRLEKRKKLYERISNIFRDTCYNGSLKIIKLNPEAIILENLDIKQIMGYKYIASNLQHYPLGIAQQIMREQCEKYNIPLIFAPPNLQSSNICSYCGYEKNISHTNFVCPNCGLIINRDLNAAINLKNWYISTQNTPYSPVSFY